MIHLHGALAQFGPMFRLDVLTPNEAARALAIQIPGFKKMMQEGRFRVIRSPRVRPPYRPARPMEMGPEDISMRLGDADLHIVPVVAGAKGSGMMLGKIVIGVILIATAVITAGASLGAAGAAAGASLGSTAAAGAAVGAAGLAAPAFMIGSLAITYSQIAMFGLAMVVGGVSGLLSQSPSGGNYSARERPDQRPSFLTNGPVNTTEEGGPVPVAIGIFAIGSKVISAGITPEQI
jgi:predicted phage tail protein